MTIKAGDKIPSVTLKHLAPTACRTSSTDSFFRGKKVVMFRCARRLYPHLFGQASARLSSTSDMHSRLEGIEVACLAVNDPFVMKAWGGGIGPAALRCWRTATRLSPRPWVWNMDGSAYGLGTRGQRFALYAENGTVKFFAVEKPGAFDVSSAEAMLKAVPGHESGGLTVYLPRSPFDSRHRQPVDSFILGMAVMAAYPDEIDLVRFHRRRSSRCHKSAFFTGFLSAVFQPRLIHPGIHSVAPFCTYWLSV